MAGATPSSLTAAQHRGDLAAATAALRGVQWSNPPPAPLQHNQQPQHQSWAGTSLPPHHMSGGVVGAATAGPPTGPRSTNQSLARTPHDALAHSSPHAKTGGGGGGTRGLGMGADGVWNGEDQFHTPYYHSNSSVQNTPYNAGRAPAAGGWGFGVGGQQFAGLQMQEASGAATPWSSSTGGGGDLHHEEQQRVLLGQMTSMGGSRVCSSN